MQDTSKEADELVRKRQRNRLAQQKYRRRLKSHIEDLEKKAAVVDRLTKDADVVVSDDLTSHFGPFANTQMNGQGSTSTDTMDFRQSMKNRSPVLGFNESPRSLQKNLGFAESESGLTDDVDFLRGLSLPTDDSSANENPFFTEIGITEIQDTNIERIRFPTGSREDNGRLGGSTPVSARASTHSSVPLRQLEIPPGLENDTLEARVDRVLRSIKNVGFSTPDSFMSSYYTGSFKERSAVQKAQDNSRSQGLPQLLDELGCKSEAWSIWQSRAYTDSIVQSAAVKIADEFDRLIKKSYSCERGLQQGLALTTIQGRMATSSTETSSSTQKLYSDAAELKKTLRNELPNLHALISSLCSDDSKLPQSTRVQLLVATIKIMAAPAGEPLREAAKWVYCRVNSSSS